MGEQSSCLLFEWYKIISPQNLILLAFHHTDYKIQVLVFAYHAWWDKSAQFKLYIFSTSTLFFAPALWFFFGSWDTLRRLSCAQLMDGSLSPCTRGPLGVQTKCPISVWPSLTIWHVQSHFLIFLDGTCYQLTLLGGISAHSDHLLPSELSHQKRPTWRKSLCPRSLEESVASSQQPLCKYFCDE